DAGDEHQGDARPGRGRAGTPRGPGAGRLPARTGPAAAQEQGHAAARQVGPGVDGVAGAGRRAGPREPELLAPHPRGPGRGAAYRDGSPPGAPRPRRCGGRRGRTAGARETPPIGQRVGSTYLETEFPWARSFSWLSWWSWLAG